MTYAEAIAYLDSLAQFGWKLDLGRIQRLCELAGHPEQQFRSVLVGGSAGKGSTCAILSAILRAAGLKTGTAPKPHLHTHRERVQVDGEMISEAQFAALMARIVPLAEQVTQEEGSPTVFEVMTLLSFLHFAEEQVDWAVVEVGLGGRFDATNVLTPDLAVIVSIGLDHTDRLGDTVEKIAFEKAGIIKPGGRVVTGAQDGALGVIEAACTERGAAIRRLSAEIQLENVRLSRDHTQFDLALPEGVLSDLRLSLTGEHQARNAALAVGAALWLAHNEPRINEAAVRAGLAAAQIPGRLQILGEQPLLIVDAAHSPDRAEALAATVQALYLRDQPDRRVILVLGCSEGHLPESVVARLAPLAADGGRIIATRSTHPAAIAPERLAEAARALGAEASVAEPASEALRQALAAAGEEDLVLVTGSIFVVGEVMRATHPSTAEES